MAEGTSLTHLTLTEIARRISAHLHRFEVAERAETAKLPYDERQKFTGRYFHAGARVSGRYVWVSYITYQHSSNLSRDEALSYLRGLDGGFEGRHYEWLRANPLPEPEPDVRFTALCRDRHGGFFLYAVTKRTATRVYGFSLTPEKYAPSFLDRSEVLKLQATEADLAAIREAEKDRDSAVSAAHEAFTARLREIIGDEPVP